MTEHYCQSEGSAKPLETTDTKEVWIKGKQQNLSAG